MTVCNIYIYMHACRSCGRYMWQTYLAEARKMTYLTVQSKCKYVLCAGCQQEETWPYLAVWFISNLSCLWQDKICNMYRFWCKRSVSRRGLFQFLWIAGLTERMNELTWRMKKTDPVSAVDSWESEHQNLFPYILHYINRMRKLRKLNYSNIKKSLAS